MKPGVELAGGVVVIGRRSHSVHLENERKKFAERPYTVPSDPCPAVVVIFGASAERHLIYRDVSSTASSIAQRERTH